MLDRREDNRPLILIHGWGTDGSVWRRQICHFQDGRQVLSPTLSTWDKEELAESFRRSGLEGAILVAWSLGAMLALEAFGELRDCLAGLVLVGAAARFRRGPDHPLGVDAVRLRAMKRRLGRDPAGTLQEFFGMFFTNDEKRTGADLRDFNRLRPSPQNCLEGLDYLMEKDLRPLLPVVDRPTLIVQGELDPITPPAQAEYLHRHIRGSTLRIFQGCGHMPFFSRPRTFNWMLEEFCREC